MAGHNAIAAVATSLERFLNHCFTEWDEEEVSLRSTKVVLVSTEDLEDTNRSTILPSPALSILLYRIEVNKTMRAAWSASGSQDGRAHLPLDLYFLLTPWADNADYELRILGYVMQCLEATPHLSGPLLEEAGWAANEVIQICPTDISTEDVMRIFDSLPIHFRLSAHYLARIVRLDRDTGRIAPSVTTAVSGLKGSVEG
jgi:hypothetical protein